MVSGSRVLRDNDAVQCSPTLQMKSLFATPEILSSEIGAELFSLLSWDCLYYWKVHWNSFLSIPYYNFNRNISVDLGAYAVGYLSSVMANIGPEISWRLVSGVHATTKLNFRFRHWGRAPVMF